jgi:hypothetical protein
LVIVKLPLVAQFVVPVRVHVPEIVFPFTVPFMASVLLFGLPDIKLRPKLPLTLPLKFPLSTNDPVSLVTVNEHASEVKLKLLTVTDDPLPVAVKLVPKAKTGFPFASVRAAVQLPLIFPEWLPEPHPARVNAAPISIAITTFFMEKLLLEWIRCASGATGSPLALCSKSWSLAK